MANPSIVACPVGVWTKVATNVMIRYLLILLMLFATPAHAADVKVALSNTFGHEGWYQCMRADSGNWTGGRVGVGELRGTKYGIAAASYPQEDIRALTLARAAYLYERDFWGQLKLTRARSQIVANEVFDAAVNMGVGTQARILQRCINKADHSGRKKLIVDGVVGPTTIERLNLVDQVELYCHLIGERYARYSFIVANDPRKEQFFRTWVYRIKDNVIAAVKEVESRRAKMLDYAIIYH